MLPKSVIACLACLAATAFVTTTTLMPTGAFARGGTAAPGGAAGNWPQEGTWNWPPYAGSGGGMAGTTCGYAWVNSYRHKPGNGQWVYRCH